MMTNLKDFPEQARAAQDVDLPPERREQQANKQSGISTGRGGGGNMITRNESSKGKAKETVQEAEKDAAQDGKQRKTSFVGNAKEMLSTFRRQASRTRTSEKDDTAI